MWWFKWSDFLSVGMIRAQVPSDSSPLPRAPCFSRCWICLAVSKHVLLFHCCHPQLKVKPTDCSQLYLFLRAVPERRHHLRRTRAWLIGLLGLPTYTRLVLGVNKMPCVIYSYSLTQVCCPSVNISYACCGVNWGFLYISILSSS